MAILVVVIVRESSSFERGACAHTRKHAHTQAQYGIRFTEHYNEATHVVWANANERTEK